MVGFVENGSDDVQLFRIPNQEDTNISSLVIAALATQTDVRVSFDRDMTIGCGNQPAIRYIRMYGPNT